MRCGDFELHIDFALCIVQEIKFGVLAELEAIPRSYYRNVALSMADPLALFHVFEMVVALAGCVEVGAAPFVADAVLDRCGVETL